LNLGRREFTKDSLAIKAIFEQTTIIGATIGSRYARYPLDPAVFKIDEIYWDDQEVEAADASEWTEQLQGVDPETQGTPYVYRLVGDSIDLYFAPNEEKLLEVYASIITTDLTTLAEPELELNDDQVQAAIYYAAFQALTDDDRDGSLYEAKFNKITRQWKAVRKKKGPRYTEQTFTQKHQRI